MIERIDHFLSVVSRAIIDNNHLKEKWTLKCRFENISYPRSLIVGRDDAGEGHERYVDYSSSSISRIVVTILRAVNSKGFN